MRVSRPASFIHFWSSAAAARCADVKNVHVSPSGVSENEASLSASVMTRSPSLAALEATGLSVMIVARPRKAQVYGRRFA
jgi:hypothetical protein